MEYADNGDVFQKICQYQQTGNLFKEKIIWKIFIQTIRGLKALHDLKILHRDMKSANIFLYRDYTAKLGDLNVSKVAKKGLLYTQTGTPYYASPEVWKDQPYDCKSDIWSLGCVLYEMCSLVPPFRADDMNGLFKKVLKGAYPQIPSNYSMDMRSVIKSLLQVNAAQRPNTEQILDMPIIVRRIKKYFKDETMNNSVMTAQLDTESELLKTIKFSKNLFKLKLPQPTYDSIQFATVPTHNFNTGKSRNAINQNQTMVTTTAAEKSNLLPKINSSSRNNMSMVSTKSQQPPTRVLNSSSIEGVSENDDEQQYDQEQFEYEDRQPHYMQPTKGRSYSGRHGPVIVKEQKVKQQSQVELVQNDYSDAGASYTLNTNRSKSTVSYQEETPQNQQQKQRLNQSPSQQQIHSIEKTSKQTSQNKQGKQSMVVVGQEHHHTPIDEKAELMEESQYEDDFEQREEIQQRNQNAKKAGIQPVRKDKSGKRSQNQISANESVNTSMQNQENNFDNRQSKIRDNSQTSMGEQQNNQSMISGTNASVAIYRQRDESSRKALHHQGSKLSNLQQIGQISRSPSNQSLEKPQNISDAAVHSLTRSQNPSTLTKSINIKPIYGGGISIQQQLPSSTPNQQPIMQQQQQLVRKSPNMDRIVSIYSINANNKAKKKKFYLNMINQSKDASSNVLNDDIRVKLRQLREGIGYYDGKSVNNRSTVENISFETNNSSSRNNGNSSVMLPELKSNLSPAQQQNYSQIVSMGGISTKKTSLDRILKGVIGGNEGVNRIYRKVFTNNNAASNIDIQGQIRQQNVPMKVRPANVYRNQGLIQHASVNSDLDIQGKSVITK